ncbi:DUF5615 family PIN-like protein [Thiocapsa bogorovii]|uniref:DUF5615 family PIN-like protein n=1 Tax=Thiocapsa bogorovii TaxID=521689 RepID=UPI001E32B8CA|nr:DUF5615 family PIN-like protein [Thiocapsa bogorovii]UHD17820.1 DUF5615 family PIN-like protein [Thiocapsa bogorovii]
MTLRLVIDVNLSPEWVPVLTEAGFETVHWTQVGDPSAPDRCCLSHCFTGRFSDYVAAHCGRFPALMTPVEQCWEMEYGEEGRVSGRCA